MSSFYIASVSSFSVVFPLLLVLFSGKQHLKNPLFIALGTLLLASGLSDAASYLLKEMGKPYLPVGNSYIIIQFLLFSYIYSRVLPDKKWLYGGLMLFAIFFAINILFIQPFTEFQGWLVFAEGIILLSYAGMSSFHLLQVLNLPAEDRLPVFDRLIAWINLAVVVYFLPNLFLFSISEFLFTELDPETARQYWSFHNVVNILKNSVFAVGIYYTGRKGGDENIRALEELREQMNKRYDVVMSRIEKDLKDFL